MDFYHFLSIPDEISQRWYYFVYNFYLRCFSRNYSGGLNGVDKGQTEAGLSQGFTYLQVFIIIIFPQAFRKMLPAIISQFVTVIKDTSLLYSVIAIQEIFGKSQILMGRYFEAGQVFTLYAIITAVYFITNFIISSFSRKLSKRWEQATE